MVIYPVPAVYLGVLSYYPMKILHISKGIYPIDQAGTEIYTTDLAEALIRQIGRAHV